MTTNPTERKRIAKTVKHILETSAAPNKTYISSTDSDADYLRIQAKIVNAWLFGVDIEHICSLFNLRVNSIFVDKGVLNIWFVRSEKNELAIGSA